MSVAVLDYGAGNLESVRNAIRAAGGEPATVSQPEEVLAADRIVFPGVGAAGTALARLRQGGLDEALAEVVHRRGRPFLGICLGMQLLAERLFEFGEHQGFGWIPGTVVDLGEFLGTGDDDEQLRVPHMGWNEVQVSASAEELFSAVRRNRNFYFCHSYTLHDTDASAIAAHTEYGLPLVAAVLCGNVFATQFHLEKSQGNGRRLMEAFLEWSP